MKKALLILAALCGLCLVSCEKPDPQPEEEVFDPMTHSYEFTIAAPSGQMLNIRTNGPYATVVGAKNPTGHLIIPDSAYYKGYNFVVTVIGDGAFCTCTLLNSVSIPNTVIAIRGGAFSGCDNLFSVTLPNTITTIEESTFSVCPSLSSINIPESVTSIGIAAFADCSFTSVVIPAAVSFIGEAAFGRSPDAAQLVSVKCCNKQPPAMGGDNVFRYSLAPNARLTVPHGSASAYRNSAWGDWFTNIVEE